MTMITCPSCGEETFTITGWADVDHCANCGRPLTGAELEPADVDPTGPRPKHAGRPRPARRPAMASAAPPSASSGGSQRAIDRRHVLLGALATGAVLVLLYVALPAIAGLDETWRRLRSGQAGWLVAALAFECLSFACYMAYFRTAFAGTAAGGWTMTYRITMAGVVATRLLAVAGAGGIALTAWALRRAGLGRREVATRMAAFYLLLYGLYMAALVLFGFGLHWGAFEGSAPGCRLRPALGGLPGQCSGGSRSCPPSSGWSRSPPPC